MIVDAIGELWAEILYFLSAFSFTRFNLKRVFKCERADFLIEGLGFQCTHYIQIDTGPKSVEKWLPNSDFGSKIEVRVVAVFGAFFAAWIFGTWFNPWLGPVPAGGPQQVTPTFPRQGLQGAQFRLQGEGVGVGPKLSGHLAKALCPETPFLDTLSHDQQYPRGCAFLPRCSKALQDFPPPWGQSIQPHPHGGGQHSFKSVFQPLSWEITTQGLSDASSQEMRQRPGCLF